MAELRSCVYSGNQLPGNVSVAQGKTIKNSTMNNSGMMCGGNLIRQQMLKPQRKSNTVSSMR